MCVCVCVCVCVRVCAALSQAYNIDQSAMSVYDITTRMETDEDMLYIMSYIYIPLFTLFLTEASLNLSKGME